MFIDIFLNLCETKGVSANKACVESGISRTSVAKWKNGSVPSGDTLQKFSDYFNVSVDYLLGTETKKDTAEDDVNLDDYEFAFFGDVKMSDLTEKDIEILKQMARTMRDQNRKNENNK